MKSYLAKVGVKLLVQCGDGPWLSQLVAIYFVFYDTEDVTYVKYLLIVEDMSLWTPLLHPDSYPIHYIIILTYISFIYISNLVFLLHSFI